MIDGSASAGPATARALLRRTLRRQRGALAAAVPLVTLWSVCEAGVPLLIGVVVDRAVLTGEWSRLLWWCAVLCVHFVVLSLGYRFGSRIAFRALQVESHRLRCEVSDRVLSQRGVRLERLPGEVLSIATGDADRVAAVVRQLVLTTAALTGLVATAVVLAVIDPVLAAVVLVGVPVVLLATQVAAPRLARRAAERQESIGRATGLATDLVRGLRPLAGIGGQDVAAARYRERSRAAVEASVRAAGSEGLLRGFNVLASGLFLALVALLAGRRAVAGDISVGELVAVVGIAQFLAEPMTLLAYLVGDLAQARASAERIVSVLTAPPLVHTGERRDGDPSAGLVLDDVDAPPLRGVHLGVGPGEVVAVVAEDPSAAAALVSLLHGERLPERGEVRLEGVPLTELASDRVRGRLVVADHHVDVFAGTVVDNVDPGGRLPAGHLAEVLAASAADEVVAHLPAGAAEPLGPDGTTLSGGQRQRLGLARALGSQAPVLVLHEPTTAVDAVTEQRIAERLRAARTGASTLVVTSSPALLAAADRVVWLRSGRVEAVAPHAVLVERADYVEAVLR